MSGHRARRLGYTLVELMIAVAIIALMVSMALILFTRLQDQQLARNAMRHVQSLAYEARNNALILGSAAGTGRVNFATNSGCLSQFSVDGTNSNGRAALVIDTADPVGPSLDTLGMSVTYISRIRRLAATTPTALAQYEIECKTVNFKRLYKDSVFFEGTTSVPAVIQGNRYAVTYDSRGFLTGLATPLAAITMQEKAGRRHQQRILVFGSGYSCMEHETNVVGGTGTGRCRRDG
jgi:prepilin-type N-terminal cleavage/methylation domain-containing protein